MSTTTPSPGETITVSGSQFHASVGIDIDLDTSTVLAHVTTSAQGDFSVDVKLPAGLTGDHAISAVGTDIGDCPVSPIQISFGASASSNGGGGLASTGTNILLGVLMALALIGIGALTLRGGRRRSTGRH